MPVEVKAIPLSVQEFRSYGSIISPDEEIGSSGTHQEVSANQGTAIKFLQVSKIENSSVNQLPNWNLFRCFPAPHLKKHFAVNSKTLNTTQHSILVLENHPQSSQTFIPMGRSSDELAYLVVVALPDSQDPRPVSYTHLDVYKRQTQTWMFP